MKTEFEIRRAVELLKEDCERLRKSLTHDVANRQNAMVFALDWVLGENLTMQALLAYIEQVNAETCGDQAAEAKP